MRSTITTTLRTVAVAAVTIPALLFGTASAADAAPTKGAVANSCAATAQVEVHKLVGTSKNQREKVSFLACGTGTSNVYRATVKTRPFYVREAGRAPVCYQAGTFYYPNNVGHESTAVLYPTVRCR